MSALAIGDQTIANMRSAQEAAGTPARVMVRSRSVICFVQRRIRLRAGYLLGLNLAPWPKRICLTTTSARLPATWR